MAKKGKTKKTKEVFGEFETLDAQIDLTPITNVESNEETSSSIEDSGTPNDLIETAESSQESQPEQTIEETEENITNDIPGVYYIPEVSKDDILFARIYDDDVQLPSYATSGSAGMDFYIPKWSVNYQERLKNINEKHGANTLYTIEDHGVDATGERSIVLTISQGGSVIIPLGVSCVIPKGTALFAKNKSGIAIKTTTLIGAEVVDSDYRGEIFAHVVNMSRSYQKFRFGQKITQFVLMDVHTPTIIEIPSGVFRRFYGNTERADGSIGSTGV